jgi:hypothetical protein
MRGVKAAVMTQADPEDALRESYGDLEMVQSKTSNSKAYVRVEDLNEGMKGERVRPHPQAACTRPTPAEASWAGRHACMPG